MCSFSQSWIDIFGARMSKAGGSLVTNAFSSSIPDLINVGGSVAAAGAASLIWIAWLMGKKFNELMETGEVIGSDAQVKKREKLSNSARDEQKQAQVHALVDHLTFVSAIFDCCIFFYVFHLFCYYTYSSAFFFCMIWCFCASVGGLS